ncbi:MAG: hypothetical protein BroJett040_11200 [Oligoflexia bacterium]|nr:MAG: hypothetical protein BroJett040_11200 [Oligoflexia bacterium]
MFKPIGYFHCDKKYPYQAARQGNIDINTEMGFIELEGGQNFEQALIGLEQFSHIWIIYQFHKNQNWKPMVLPPRGSSTKIGVFATRSPYRPNPIGMTCVQLRKIEGRKVFVSGFDLLDGTPVLDLKPYLAYADSFPEANMGWIQNEKYEIQFSIQGEQQLQFLEKNGEKNIRGFIINQLSFDPLNADKKRISLTNENIATLSYRTWRVDFTFANNGPDRAINNQEDCTITINGIRSGYSSEELLLTSPDPYQDKQLHRLFVSQFHISDNSSV